MDKEQIKAKLKSDLEAFRNIGIFLVSIFVLWFVGGQLIGYWLFSGLLSGKPLMKELVENYENKSNEIYELVDYVKQNTPDEYVVYLEYEKKNKIDFFVGKKVKVGTHLRFEWLFMAWSYHIKTPYKDNTDGRKKKISYNEAMRLLNWNDETLHQIFELLKEANCISFETGEPFSVGYARSGMGKYLYNFFEKPIPEGHKARWNDKENFVLYNERVVLEYGAGAGGRQVFSQADLED